MTTARAYYSPAVERAERLDTAWRARAACLDKPYDLFFSTVPELQAAAKRVCFHECPVRRACLAYALEAREDEFLVWGGLTPAERQRMRKRGRSA